MLSVDMYGHPGRYRVMSTRHRDKNGNYQGGDGIGEREELTEEMPAPQRIPVKRKRELQVLFWKKLWQVGNRCFTTSLLMIVRPES
jgi:hypothetical protein